MNISPKDVRQFPGWPDSAEEPEHHERQKVEIVFQRVLIGCPLP
jgi:hypothetical protein